MSDDDIPEFRGMSEEDELRFKRNERLRVNEEYANERQINRDLFSLRQVWEAHTPEQRARIKRVLWLSTVLQSIMRKSSDVLRLGSLCFDTELLHELNVQWGEQYVTEPAEKALFDVKPFRVPLLIALLAFDHWERGEPYTFVEVSHRGHADERRARWSEHEANPFTSVVGEFQASVTSLFDMLKTERRL